MILTNTAQLTYVGYPTAQNASASVTMAKSFQVKIGVYNEAGELVKYIYVQELSQEITNFNLLQNPTITSLNGKVYVYVDGQMIATWDGTNQNGTPVSNGTYYVKVDNVDSLGVDTSVSEEVTVSRSIASVEVDVYNEAGEVVKHLYAYADDPGNMNLSTIAWSTGVIQPVASGTPTANGSNQLTLTFPNGVTVVWNGTDDSGAVVTDGTYEVSVHWQDGKGGDQVITKDVVVENRPGNLGVGTVYVGPNVVQPGKQSVTVGIQNPGMVFNLATSVYDTAGELVRVPVISSGPNLTNLDVSKLADGLYLVVVNLTDGNGHFFQKQIVKLVVRK